MPFRIIDSGGVLKGNKTQGQAENCSSFWIELINEQYCCGNNSSETNRSRSVDSKQTCYSFFLLTVRSAFHWTTIHLRNEVLVRLYQIRAQQDRVHWIPACIARPNQACHHFVCRRMGTVCVSSNRKQNIRRWNNSTNVLHLWTLDEFGYWNGPLNESEVNALLKWQWINKQVFCFTVCPTLAAKLMNKLKWC